MESMQWYNCGHMHVISDACMHECMNEKVQDEVWMTDAIVQDARLQGCSDARSGP